MKVFYRSLQFLAHLFAFILLLGGIAVAVYAQSIGVFVVSLAGNALLNWIGREAEREREKIASGPTVEQQHAEALEMNRKHGEKSAWEGPRSWFAYGLVWVLFFLFIFNVSP